jgi:hypothetical protein
VKICSKKHDEIVHNSRACPLCEALVLIEALETFGQFKPVQAVLPLKTTQEEVPYPPIYKSLVMLPQNDSAPATNDVCKQETKAESSIFRKE